MSFCSSFKPIHTSFCKAFEHIYAILLAVGGRTCRFARPLDTYMSFCLSFEPVYVVLLVVWTYNCRFACSLNPYMSFCMSFYKTCRLACRLACCLVMLIFSVVPVVLETHDCHFVLKKHKQDTELKTKAFSFLQTDTIFNVCFVSVIVLQHTQ